MRLLRAFALLLISIIFFQCQKELSHVGGADPQPSFPDPVTAVISGNVLDENGQPANGVNIKVGGKQAVTDGRGFFRLTEASLDRNGSLVTAEKQGYYKAYRVFNASEAANHVTIKLLPRTVTGTIDASAGGTVTHNSGLKITLPANGVVVESTGSPYTGTMNVYSIFIDPTSADIDQIVPGSFDADDKNGNRVILTSFGMMIIELESSSGQKLQVKQGSKATITSPIPSSLLSTAPATIPLWYVDDATGIWKEEGSSTRNGNFYVGDVSHFTPWNVDIPNPNPPVPMVKVSMKIKNTDGTPLIHARTRLWLVTETPSFVFCYTDSLGGVSRWVPINTPFRVELVDECHIPFFSQDFAGQGQDADVGDVTISTSASTSSVITIKGKLVNCSNAPVTDGFAMINLGNSTHFAAVDANGNFSTNFTICQPGPQDFEVMGIDEAAIQQGNWVNANINGAVNDIGTVFACGTSAAQFITYTIQGNNYSITAPPDSVTAITFSDSVSGPNAYITYLGGIRLQGGIPTQYINLQFSHVNQVNGTFNIIDISTIAFPQNTVIQPSTVTVTNFPTGPGQFYEGSFQGSFQAGTVQNFSGTFRIRRN